MSHVPSDHYAQVNHTISGGRRPAQVTYGIHAASAFDAGVVAAAFHTQFATDVMPMISYQYSLESTHAKVGPDDTGGFSDYDDVVVGGLAVEPESSQVAVIGRKVTATGGSWNRGRIFFPGAASVYVNNGGVLDSGYQTDWADAMDTWLTSIVGLSSTMVVLHSLYSTHNGVRVPNPHLASAPSDVVDISIEAVVATQRRRLRG